MKISSINNVIHNTSRKNLRKAGAAFVLGTSLLASCSINKPVNNNVVKNNIEISDSLEKTTQKTDMTLNELFNDLNNEYAKLEANKKEGFWDKQIPGSYNKRKEEQKIKDIKAEIYKQQVLAENNGIFSIIKAKIGALVIKSPENFILGVIFIPFLIMAKLEKRKEEVA